jgi:ferredoxin
MRGTGANCMASAVKDAGNLQGRGPRSPGPALWQNAASNPAVEPHEETPFMAYVITEPCIGTKDNSCVEVCPVDCIHPTPDEPDYDSVEMLYIDPEECIDCDACVEACPVDACFAEDQVPDEWNKFVQINADYFKKA